MRFLKLFRPSETPSDGYTQPAREALVDVLHYCMYADKHIALAEDAFIEKAARTLIWDARVSYDYYEGKSVGAARRALDDPEFRDTFFQSVRERLANPEQRQFALKLAANLMTADGSKTDAEHEALVTLKKILS